MNNTHLISLPYFSDSSIYFEAIANDPWSFYLDSGIHNDLDENISEMINDLLSNNSKEINSKIDALLNINDIKSKISTKIQKQAKSKPSLKETMSASRKAAEKLAKDLRGVAVWIGAGQLHRVLAAQATFLHRGSGATFSKTFA